MNKWEILTWIYDQLSQCKHGIKSESSVDVWSKNSIHWGAEWL